jgi:hypothetical protein
LKDNTNVGLGQQWQYGNNKANLPDSSRPFGMNKKSAVNIYLFLENCLIYVILIIKNG